MYLDAKVESLMAYDAAIEGDVDAAACVVSYGGLPERAKTALEAACAGIGMPAPVFLDAAGLDQASALAVLEGLDPEVVIVADEVAAALLSQAYRVEVALDAYGRLLCRPCVAFSSFQEDLERERTKQRDWALMKALRRPSGHHR